MPIKTAQEALDGEYRARGPVTDKTRRQVLVRAHSIRGSARVMHGKILTAERRKTYAEEAGS